MIACLTLLISLASMLLGKEEIEIVFVGDAMQHQAQLDAARSGGKDKGYDYSDCFTEIAPIIKAADFAVVNLECPLGKTGFSGYPAFCAPDSYAAALKNAGFDLALTANNHILDRHSYGLRHTIHTLDSIGMLHIGTYSDRSDRNSLVPLLTDIGGVRIAFLNYTYSTNGIPCPPEICVDYLDLATMKADIDLSRKKGAEIIVVCPHWGEEYQLVNNDTQRRLADSLITFGADIIIGSHPHVIQPMELRSICGRKAFVSYSLGNFISAMKIDNSRGGALCTVRISRDKDGRPYIAGASYRLIFTQRTRKGNTERFTVVPAEKRLDDNELDIKRKAFVRNAENIFSRHNIDVLRDTLSVKDVIVRKMRKMTDHMLVTDDR